MSELSGSRVESEYPDGQNWPDQVWIDFETGIPEIRPPREDFYKFGDTEMPISAYRDLIVDTVGKNPAVILMSGTGNGKSIYVPQFLYESGQYRRVYQTQPMVVATRENSEYMRETMARDAGHSMDDIVAYRTAAEGDELLPTHTIRNHTDGYMLQAALANEDYITNDDVVIVDEAHLRNPNIDIFIALALQKNIRLVIQSASINGKGWAEYCSSVLGGEAVPVIDMPGVKHPVEKRVGGAVKDEVLKYITNKDGEPQNTMVLVPGARDSQMIMGQTIPRKPMSRATLELNGGQSIRKQRLSFASYPDGKDVISTDIGRQSITIPDLDVVIDSGWHKIGDYRQGVHYLRVVPVSKAGLIQGEGRVGRTKPGLRVLAQLPDYPPIPYDSEGNPVVDSYEVPPIQRTDPAPYILKLAQAGLDLYDLPLQDKIRLDEQEYANRKLVKLGAKILNCNTITDIGEKMLHLSSLDPAYARMVVEADHFGDKIKLQMLAAACAVQQDGITVTEDGAEQWRGLTNEKRSDVLAQLDIFIKALNMTPEQLEQFNIIEPRIIRARNILERMCHDQGLDIENLEIPNPAERERLIQCIVAGSDMIFFACGDSEFSNGEGFRGRLARSTTIETPGRYILGSPMVLEHYRKKILKTHNIVTNATVVTAEQLEKYAPWRCTFDDNELFVDRSGVVRQRDSVYFDGKTLRKTTVRNVEPNEETTRVLVQKMFDSPDSLNGDDPKLEQLRSEILRIRDMLVNRSDKEEYYKQIISAIQTDVESWHGVEVSNMHDLAQVLHKRRVFNWLQNTLTADSFEAQDIEDHAPRTMIVDIPSGIIEATIEYDGNKAFVDLPFAYAHYLESEIDQFEGRQVYVWVDSSHKNYMTLHKAIERSKRGNRAARRARRKK